MVHHTLFTLPEKCSSAWIVLKRTHCYILNHIKKWEYWSSIIMSKLQNKKFGVNRREHRPPTDHVDWMYNANPWLILDQCIHVVFRPMQFIHGVQTMYVVTACARYVLGGMALYEWYSLSGWHWRTTLIHDAIELRSYYLYHTKKEQQNYLQLQRLHKQVCFKFRSDSPKQSIMSSTIKQNQHQFHLVCLPV